MRELLALMAQSRADYTLLFQQLSSLPSHAEALSGCFYVPCAEELQTAWTNWLQRWHGRLQTEGDVTAATARMRQANPSLTWREWLVAPAYQQAEQGETLLLQELQEAFRQPYGEQTEAIASKYCRLKPREFFNAGGISHYSCSS